MEQGEQLFKRRCFSCLKKENMLFTEEVAFVW